jgi:hypothetical protein
VKKTIYFLIIGIFIAAPYVVTADEPLTAGSPQCNGSNGPPMVDCPNYGTPQTGNNAGNPGQFVDPDCPPGTPAGTTCLPGGIIQGQNGNNAGNPGQFVDPDCPPGTPAGTTCLP